MRRMAGPFYIRTDLLLYENIARAPTLMFLRYRRVERHFEERRRSEQSFGWLRGLLVFGPLFVHRVLAGFDGGGQFRFLAVDEILGIINRITNRIGRLA